MGHATGSDMGLAFNSNFDEDGGGEEVPDEGGEGKEDYMGTSLIRNSAPLGPNSRTIRNHHSVGSYSRTMPRLLW